MESHQVVFEAPGVVHVRTRQVPSPAADEVLVASSLSAISAGSEMLVYRGQFPAELPVDESLPDLAGPFQYPLPYGYAVVGSVVEVGPEVEPAWQNRRVFTFHPHESLFVTKPSHLIPLPNDVPPEDAVFLANAETAVNLLQDGRPVLGEAGLVIGQGVVGLLTTALLTAWTPLLVVTMDLFAARREMSRRLGAHASLDATSTQSAEMVRDLLRSEANSDSFDLIYELSGNPEALNLALQLAGFHTRIVIGS